VRAGYGLDRAWFGPAAPFRAGSRVVQVGRRGVPDSGETALNRSWAPAPSVSP